MSAPKTPKRVWQYAIDLDGNILHEGYVMDDPELTFFFLKNLKRDPNGKIIALCQGELCEFDCADVPYVVQNIQERSDGIWLVFQAGYEEKLDLKTLEVKKENILYCKVREGLFEARFSRKAYLDLAHQIELDAPTGKYYLTQQGQRYWIQGVKQ